MSEGNLQSRRRWRSVLAFGILITLGLVSSGVMQAKQPLGEEALYKELELFTDALSIVRADYVEAPESKKLIYGALKGMLSTLDPHRNEAGGGARANKRTASRHCTRRPRRNSRRREPRRRVVTPR
jgi:hypothetical protein